MHGLIKIWPGSLNIQGVSSTGLEKQKCEGENVFLRDSIRSWLFLKFIYDQKEQNWIVIYVLLKKPSRRFKLLVPKTVEYKVKSGVSNRKVQKHVRYANVSATFLFNKLQTIKILFKAHVLRFKQSVNTTLCAT